MVSWAFFFFFNFWEYCSVHTKTLHRIKVKESQKKLGKYFLEEKQFFRAKNLNVSTKRPSDQSSIGSYCAVWLSYIDTKCNHFSPLNHNVWQPRHHRAMIICSIKIKVHQHTSLVVRSLARNNSHKKFILTTPK